MPDGRPLKSHLFLLFLPFLRDCDRDRDRDCDRDCDRERERERGLERIFTKTVITKRGKYTDRVYTQEQHKRWYKMFKQLVKYKNHVCSCSHQV